MDPVLYSLICDDSVTIFPSSAWVSCPVFFKTKNRRTEKYVKTITGSLTIFNSLFSLKPNYEDTFHCLIPCGYGPLLLTVTKDLP